MTRGDLGEIILIVVFLYFAMGLVATLGLKAWDLIRRR